jgi:hypothetical protein
VAGIAAGASGLLAGAVAAAWGFVAVFILAGIFSFVAAFALIAVPDLVLPKATATGVALKDKTPPAGKI